MSEVSSTIHNGFDFATNCGVPWFGDPVGLLNPESIVLYIFALIWLLFGIRVVSDEYFAVRYKWINLPLSHVVRSLSPEKTGVHNLEVFASI